MIHRFLLCIFLFSFAASAYPAEVNVDRNYDRTGENWDWITARKRAAVVPRIWEWISPTFPPSAWEN